MTSEIATTADQHFDLLERAIILKIKGMNPTQIASEMQIARYQVVDLIEEWQAIVAADDQIVARSREAVAAADKHYDELIGSAHEVVEQADSVPDDPKFMAQKLSALKLIGDLQQKRFTMLKEVGALQSADIAAELAEREQREEAVLGILREVICENCKPEVARRLAQLSQDAPVVIQPINDV